MNNSYFKLIIIFCFSAAMLAACNNTEQDKNSPEHFENTKEAINEAYEALQEDVASYRLNQKEKIDAHKQRISEFSDRLDAKKSNSAAQLQREAVILQSRLDDLQFKMNAYKAASQDNWETFKTEFNRDMEEVETELDKLISPASK